MATGTILNYAPTAVMPLVKSDDGSTVPLPHATIAASGIENLKAGQRVSFDILRGNGRPGQPPEWAANLKLIPSDDSVKHPSMEIWRFDMDSPRVRDRVSRGEKLTLEGDFRPAAQRKAEDAGVSILDVQDFKFDIKVNNTYAVEALVTYQKPEPQEPATDA